MPSGCVQPGSEAALHAGTVGRIWTPTIPRRPSLATPLASPRPPTTRAATLAAEVLGDASCPQAKYQQLVEAQVMEAMPGMYMVASRARGRGHVQEQRGVLVGGLPGAGQRAPAHPAQRRPAPAPEVPQGPRPDLRSASDGRDRGRRHRPRQPLHRPVRSARRVPLHARVRRAVPVGGVPRAHGSAVGGARHLPAPEGRHHPSRHHRDGRRRSASRSSATPARSSTPTSTPSSTSASPSPEGRHPHALQHRGDRRRAAHAGGDPRHLLPLLHRRPRHRDRLVVVLLRVPRAARRPPARDRREPRHHPERRGGAAAVGDAGAQRAAHGDHRRLSGRGPHDPAGIVRARERGRGQRRPGRVRRPDGRALRPRRQPPSRVRWRRAPVPRFAPGAPGAARHAARVAPSDPRVLDQARHRAAVRRRPAPGREPGAGLAHSERRGRRAALPGHARARAAQRRAAGHVRARRRHDGRVAASRTP